MNIQDKDWNEYMGRIYRDMKNNPNSSTKVTIDRTHNTCVGEQDVLL